jgi:hypothetical protein
MIELLKGRKPCSPGGDERYSFPAGAPALSGTDAQPWAGSEGAADSHSALLGVSSQSKMVLQDPSKAQLHVRSLTSFLNLCVYFKGSLLPNNLITEIEMELRIS